jgi:hypothetical protein
MGDLHDSEEFNPSELAKEFVNHPDHRIAVLAKFSLFAADLMTVMLAFSEQLKTVQARHSLVHSENESPAS